MKNMIEHDFYCMNCGEKNISLFRKKGFQHKKHHRKIMYCYHCKQTLNHIECKTPAEVEEFKTNFKNGVYQNEAKESLDYVRHTRQW